MLEGRALRHHVHLLPVIIHHVRIEIAHGLLIVAVVRLEESDTVLACDASRGQSYKHASILND